jgi:SAM-dependent methyltransferase
VKPPHLKRLDKASLNSWLTLPEYPDNVQWLGLRTDNQSNKKMNINLKVVLQYAVTIFLSAFLLFQVQPLIAKMILPWFGGSASVWTTCMLFFQLVLLLGYVYSHWVVQSLSAKRQSYLHIALIFLSLLILPIQPSQAWQPVGNENPTVQILGLLLVSIGLPYFVLSTTGPLLQAWFAREKSGTVPYRLFALSNFGSLLALLAYPIAIEPFFASGVQSYMWSGLFLVFALICGVLAWRNRNVSATSAAEQSQGSAEMAAKIKRTDYLSWVFLAACPSILMVADTSYLTENVAPIPMLWVLPLALYLLSFILCFEGNNWYRRKFYIPLFVVSVFILAFLPTISPTSMPLMAFIGINLIAFFVICMVCHGELAKQQPAPRFLTIYYLMLALGGLLGGLFVGVIAPYAFNGNYEFSVGIILVAVVVFAVLNDKLLRQSHYKRVAFAFAVVSIVGLAYVRANDHIKELAGADVKVRNFYGTINVFTDRQDNMRYMAHGTVTHGEQFLSPELSKKPTAYYVEQGGAGKALLFKALQSDSIKVGVVGLGVGTLATYGRAKDAYTFYEINPQVIELAEKNFSYLSDTKASKKMVLGDARIQLEHEAPNLYDVLIIDAFSGDSIPVHLLTLEAFAEYFRHLKPDGILAVHITNWYFDLAPVIKTAADHLGKDSRIVSVARDRAANLYRSQWAVISSDKAFFASEGLKDASTISLDRSFRAWKDGYSSLLSVLKKD